MMAEVRMDLAEENLNWSKNICWVLVLLVAAWKRPFPDLLKFPCCIHFMSSSRDSNHPTPPANPVYGDIGLIRRAAARLAMAK